MRARTGRLLLWTVLALGTACAARQRSDRPERVDRTVLTREQMLDGHYTNVYDAVEALHPTWLRPRGPDSFVSPSIVWVYVDDSRAGDIEVLRSVQPGLVNTVRFYDGPQATGRWGVNNSAGVIHISTWGDGALGFPRTRRDTGSTPGASGGATGERWVATWGAAPQLTEERNLPPAPGLAGSTLRQIVHVSLGGPRLRVRFSNEFGDGPMRVDAAHLAKSAGGGAIQPRTDVVLAFGGATSVTVPAGGAIVSDPVDFPLDALSDVAVSIHFVEMPRAVTGHPGSRTTSYLEPGDRVADSVPSQAVRVEHWYALTGIDVTADDEEATVVVLGNSITDGRGSGTDRNDRWPDNLARRLQADRRTEKVGVVNVGIGGNCVVKCGLGPPAVDRFDRDVLSQHGARWLIVLEGVNDIGGARGADGSARVADTLIAAYSRMIAKARAEGLRVYGATILPFGGSFYDTPDHEAARQTVNRWIRTSGAFDAVIDFDAALRDPASPARLLGVADGGDHLHPNEAGYRMMADVIDLALFRR